jgi:hypothetical protein
VGDFPVPVSELEAPLRWTCGNCGVEVRWHSNHEQRGLPANWTLNHQGPVCLHCRRELAANAAVSSLDLSLQERARLRSSTVVDFEVRRAPNRTNSQIASAVHTSVVAVQKARERLGASAAAE